MAVNKAIYNRTFERERKKGTPLEKAMKIADRQASTTAKRVRKVIQKPSLYARVKKRLGIRKPITEGKSATFKKFHKRWKEGLKNRK